ncbi:MAG: patatin-like phospholipase family protein [Gammaproteobacteria bacterium]|nr:patatin-like phospholipase family protein [Gammaproteobacteria bacterium]
MSSLTLNNTVPLHCNSLQWNLLLGFFALLIYVQIAPAAAPEAPQHRPKIGLALGGGGARGLAHIGVLKVLEELRVPIDYITGTSSGAIIGGMYAAGLSPDQIEMRIIGIDWDDMLSDRLARRDLSYRRKQNDRNYLFPVEFGMRGLQPIFPRGLIAGQKVGFFLRSATLRAAGVTDFDKLAVPFRAVATDIETGAPVVLRSGDLAEAMQASMAVPGVFSPLEIGGRLLVDGGMSANVPVETLRAMGADIIIAVNISAPLLNRKQLESIVDISDQTLSMLSLKTNQLQLQQLHGDDILITPDLSSIGTMQFERGAEAVTAGTAAALAQEVLLRNLSAPPKDYTRYLRRQRTKLAAVARVDFIKIDKPERVSEEIITRRLTTRTGTQLDIDTLRGDMTRIYDLGDFERVNFRVVQTDAGEGLEIDAQEKSWGPNYLRLGLNLTDDFEGDSRFNILINYTRTWVNPLGGEWKNEFSIGRTRKIFTEFYQPLDPYSVWFVAPHAQFNQDTRDVYDGDDRIAQYSTKTSEIGFATGLQLGKHGEVRFGLLRDWVRAAPRVGAADLPHYDIRQGAYTTSVAYDRVDDVNFPRNGTLIRSNLFMARKELGADTAYDKLDINWLTAFTYNTHTMFASVELGTNLNNKLPFYDLFTLGGFQNLSGYHAAQLSGKYLAFSRLVYYERVGHLPKAAGNGVYFGASLEGGNVWDNRDDVGLTDLRKSISLFASADTTMGPLYFAYGLSDGGNYMFYLFLGRTF